MEKEKIDMKEKWQTFTEKDGLAGNWVLSIIEDKTGHLWFGTYGEGVSRYDGRKWKSFSEEDGLADNRVFSIIEDRSGHLWFGTNEGVSRYDGKDWVSFTKKDGLAGNGVRSIIEDRSGHLWFGTNGGVSRYDGKDWVSFKKKDGLAGNYVCPTIEDRSGHLWFGTYGGGVSRYTPTYILAKNYLDNNKDLLYPVIYQIFEDAKDPSSSIKDLCKIYRQEDNQHLANILDVYYQLSSFVEITEVSGMAAKLTHNLKPVLSKAIELFSTTKNLPYGEEVYLTYKTLSHLTFCKAIDDIIISQVEIRKLFKLKKILREEIIEAFKKLDEIITALCRYEEVEVVQSKANYLIHTINLCEEAVKFVDEHLLEPEKPIFLYLLPHLRGIIHQALKALTGKAEIRCELKTKEMPFQKEIEVVLNIRNDGMSEADSVKLELIPSSDYSIIYGDIWTIPGISPKQSVSINPKIKPIQRDQIRLEFKITYDDFETKGKTISFADILTFIRVKVFTEIPNPYNPGKTIEAGSKLFYGRDDLFEFVNKNIKGLFQNNILCLVGQKRTGKTSFLYQLPLRISNEYIPVFINLQRIVGEGFPDFVFKLAKAIRDALSKKGVDINLSGNEGFSSNIFEDFLKNVYEKIGNRYLLLLIDEFQALEEQVDTGHLDKTIFGYIRALMLEEERLAFIFSGSEKLERLNQDYWGRMFNIAIYKDISLLERDEAEALITKPVFGSLDYDSLAIERILELTSGHPYFVQVLCYLLVNYANKTNISYINIEDVNGRIGDVFTTASFHLNDLWKDLNKDEKDVLLLMAEKDENLPFSFVVSALKEKGKEPNREEILMILDSLVQRDYLERIEGFPPHYRFRVPIFRLWIEKEKIRGRG